VPFLVTCSVHFEPDQYRWSNLPDGSGIHPAGIRTDEDPGDPSALGSAGGAVRLDASKVLPGGGEDMEPGRPQDDPYMPPDRP